MRTSSNLLTRAFLLAQSILFSVALVACNGSEATLAITPTSNPPDVTSSPTQRPAATEAAPTTAPAETAQATGTLGVEEESLHGLHIRYWYTGSLDYKKAVDNRVRVFNASPQAGIWIEPSYFGSAGEMMDRIKLVSADQRPDLVLTYPALTGEWPRLGIETVDLEPYIHDPTWGFLSEELKNFPANLFSSSYSDGLAGFPGYRVADLLFYNQTWAEELGFSAHPPTTPQEFQVQACEAAKANQKSKDPTKTGTGGWIAANSPEVVLSWIGAFGGKDPVSENFRFQNDAANQALAFLKAMFDKGCAWVARNPDPSVYFANRQALFFSGTSADFNSIDTALANNKSKDLWKAIPYPGQSRSPVIYGAGPDYYILKSSPERQLAAWKFIHWMSQAENQAVAADTSGIFPTRTLTPDELPQDLKKNLNWYDAFKMLNILRQMPGAPEWVTIGPILQDAAGQLFQTGTKPDQVSSILDMLDRTIQEVVSRNP